MMVWLLVALGVISASGLAALLLGRRDPQRAHRIGALGIASGNLLGLVPVTLALVSGGELSLRLPWPVPYASFALGVDPLTAWFLLPVLALCGLAAGYGLGYLKPHLGKKDLGAHWAAYALLNLGMVLVLLARNWVLFLVAWELMSTASYLLVTFEHERSDVRHAGWTYWVATHLGVVCLIACFTLLGQSTGSFEIGRDPALLTPGTATACFLLALAGFGAKAGILPMHVWLPEAHPAAPSHVSAVMSGVMIKLGIYGLLRILPVLGPPPAWWAYLLMGLGMVSGVLGVLYALVQHDLKRLLAYHSVENIGIIFLGMGAGLLGVHLRLPALSLLGFGAALLHVLNHAVFKGLLFLGAGAVLTAVGSGNLDTAGGLLRRMPVTGAAFLVGAAAISGLPPLNGFVSEFLLYLGALQAGAFVPALPAGALWVLVAGLALIGGLAAACFAKVVGTVFLGDPRTPAAARAAEVPFSLRGPQIILAAACVVLGLAGPVTFRLVAPAAARLAGPELAVLPELMTSATRTLTLVTCAALGFWALLAVVAGLQRVWPRRRTVVRGEPTWDCGYAQPTPRMQYTASSFARPLARTFSALVRTRRRGGPPQGRFPEPVVLHSETPDPFQARLFAPVFSGVDWALGRLRWLQHGRVQLYVLYIAAALAAMLLWGLR